MSGYIEAYTRTGKKGRRVLDSKLCIALIIGIGVGMASGYVVAKATPDAKDCSILDQEATQEMQNSDASQKDFQKKRQQMFQNLLDDLEQKTK